MEQEVRIVFTASKSWFGKFIRLITRSKVSHVFIEFPIWGQKFAAEATVGGTRIVPLYKSKHNVVAEFVCLFPISRSLLKLTERLGTPYDWSGTFLLGILIIWWRWISFKAKSVTWSTKALKCSELTWHFFDDSGTEISKVVGREKATPDDILRYCKARTLEFRQV